MKERIADLLSKLHDKSTAQLVKKISKVTSSRSFYLNIMQAGGGISIILGTLISALGFYGLASGKGINFVVADGIMGMDPLLAGALISLVGVLLTFEGAALVKINVESFRLVFYAVVLGYCTLNVPAILLGFGYSLIAGIFAIVFGYLWLAAVLAWLQRGE
ncbi:MAG: hypothetical protein QXG27_01740 [Candidatus Bathyarchaeia archaeon]